MGRNDTERFKIYSSSHFLRFVVLSWLLVLATNYGLGQDPYLSYDWLPELPPAQGEDKQPGLAGAYAGIDDGVLIVAGGANFPDTLPWENGTKHYHDAIYLLRQNPDGNYEWSEANAKLPQSSAYGGAISTSKGLLCFGGNSSGEVISSSWLINYLPETGEIGISPGPEMPVALTNFAFAGIGNTLYIAGGTSEMGGQATKAFYRLSIDDNDPQSWEWEALDPWVGKPRAFAVAAAQSNGLDNCFYLFSGRDIQADGSIDFLVDAHVYNPVTGHWSVVSNEEGKPFEVMAGTAFPLGASSIIFPTGSDGELARTEIAIKKEIARLGELQGNSGEEVQELEVANKELTDLLNNHPGFGNKVYAFNTITKELYPFGEMPGTGMVTTPIVAWSGEYIIPSGEISPGIRTPKILRISARPEQRFLKTVDMVVLFVYFIILAWMGYFFSKRQKNINDYFKGGGRIPWWAAGLSIFGTALSAITFMAIPAKTYATDWSYFIFNMTIFLVAPVIVFGFIPFYRKLNVTTAYEFLEIRFNLLVRLIGSLSFIFFQIGRMGVVLFLPAIALNLITGFDIYVCITLMSLVSIAYTMYGGIEAVIWTDVMQVIVLLGGALLSLWIIMESIDGGFFEVMEVAREENKFNILTLDWSLRQPTVWVMLLGGIFANITTYGTDQTMVQRYLTTKDQREAEKSVWTNAILVIPASLIFFFVGTALFVFYKAYPQTLNPGLVNLDGIFPLYIVSQLPSGLSGLLIAGIFAAAMSSLSSSMNSAATAYSNDIHFRFNLTSGLDELSIAKLATLIIGIIGTVFAFFMASMDVKSLWDEFQKVLGLIIGGLGGVFLLGIFTKRVNSTCVLLGIAVSIVVQLFVALYEPVHILLYSATGVVSCFLTGLVASLFIREDLEG